MHGVYSRRRRIRSGYCPGIFSLGYIIASWGSVGVLSDSGVSSASPLRVQDNIFDPIADYDPVKDLCQRWYHQTVIANNTLYIDGGYWINKDQVPDGSRRRDDVVTLQNQYLLQVDLRNSFEASKPPYNPHNKPSMIANTTQGYLFPDQGGDSFNLYGGAWAQYVTTSVKQSGTPSDFNIYTYDTGNQAWERNFRPLDAGIKGYTQGAGARLPEQNLAFYFGGISNNKTDPQSGDTTIQNRNENMLRWNLTDNTWDVETPDISTRTGASLVPLPDVGLQGILVLIGGTEESSGSQLPARMESVRVYDVASKSWYLQAAVAGNNGDGMPSSRTEFCTGLGTATDFSSYQIFMYGGSGLGGDSSKLLDEMWILTIPTFEWVKVDIKDSMGMDARHGHTCEVNRGQMLVVGGDTSNDNYTCSASQFGVFDMSSLSWAKNYEASHDSYKVPLTVSQLIGGSSTGRAIRTTPPTGFTENGLKDVFAKKPLPRPHVQPDGSTSSSSSPETIQSSTASPSSGRSVNVGMIVGATIAGMIGLLLIIAIPIFFFWRRRKQHRESKKGKKAGKYKGEKSRGQPRGQPRGQARGHSRARGKARGRGVAPSEAGASNPDTWFSGDEKEDEDIMTPLNENWGYGMNSPPAPRRANTESSGSGTVQSMGEYRRQRPRTVEISPDAAGAPFGQSAEIVNDYTSDGGVYVEDSASQRGDLNYGPAASVRDLMSVATMSSDALPQHYPYHHHHHHSSQQYQNQQFNYPQLNPHMQHLASNQTSRSMSDGISPVSPQSHSGPSELDISPATRSPRVKATDFYYNQRPAPTKRGSSAPSTKSDTSEATVVSPETRWNTHSVQSNHSIPRKPVSNRNSTASPITPPMVS